MTGFLFGQNRSIFERERESGSGREERRTEVSSERRYFCDGDSSKEKNLYKTKKRERGSIGGTAVKNSDDNYTRRKLVVLKTK